jgi:hypothetical protein
MKDQMKPTAANFYTSNYGKTYKEPNECKISKEVLAKDAKGNLIEKDGYVYFTTNPEKYVPYKNKHSKNQEFNWLWEGGYYSTNPENHSSNDNYWKLDKYNNVMGEDLYVSYKVLVPKNKLDIVI